MEKELDFDPVIPVLNAWKKWWLAAIAAIAAGLLAFVYVESSNIPRYTVSCTVAVHAGGSGNAAASVQGARAFAEVVTSPVIAALEESGGVRLRGMLRAEVLEQTNFVTLIVTADRAQQAMDAMELLLEQHAGITREAAGELTLEILEPPVLPTEPDPGEDPMKAFGKAAWSLFAAVLVLMMLCDGTTDRVRSSDEAMRKLCCPLLGTLHRRGRRNENRWEQELDRLTRRIDQTMGGGILLLTGEGDPAIPEGIARHLKCRGKTVLVSNRIPEEMEQSYALILLPEAPALEQLEQADGVLLLIRHDRTRAKEANRLAGDLNQGRARLLGCVLWDFWSTGLFDGEAAASGWYTGKGVKK